jgi:phenylalanyl-tRNA synthetase beta chain
MLSLKIGNDDSTMTSKQIEKKMNGIIKVLGKKCGAQLR